MLQTIKKVILSSALFTLLVVPFAAPATVSAVLDCDGTIAECTDQGAVETDPENTGDAEERVSNIIKTVIDIFSLIVGVVSVIMIIIGGLKYITSGGDSGNVTGAKNTILYAVIGLIVVVLAQVIVRFVLKRTGDT